MLKHDSAIPLYQQIENDIKEKLHLANTKQDKCSPVKINTARCIR